MNTEICDLALNENQPQEDGPETADEEVIFLTASNNIAVLNKQHACCMYYLFFNRSEIES